jgi:hypothetical protein
MGLINRLANNINLDMASGLIKDLMSKNNLKSILVDIDENGDVRFHQSENKISKISVTDFEYIKNDLIEKDNLIIELEKENKKLTLLIEQIQNEK